MSKKKLKSKQIQNQEWPVVVYMWTFGFALLGYLVIGEAVFESKPHPIHWLSGLVAGVVGIGIGWLWFRWRGDVF